MARVYLCDFFFVKRRDEASTLGFIGELDFTIID
jgi:hypothetical protein